MAYENYRHYILGEFERRKVRNPAYSLRALARDLEVSPSRLSEALNARRGLSLQMAEHLIRKLELQGREAEVFRLSVAAEHARSAQEKSRARAQLVQLLQEAPRLAPKTFTMVDWVTEVVLKMSERPGALEEPERIASRLDVPSFMVVGALRFLTRLGLVRGLDGYRTYLEDRGLGRRLNVDHAQVLERAQKAYVGGVAAADLFHHQALLLEPRDLEKARVLVLDCFAELKKLEKKTKAAKVVFAAAQVFTVEKEGRKS